MSYSYKKKKKQINFKLIFCKLKETHWDIIKKEKEKKKRERTFRFLTKNKKHNYTNTGLKVYSDVDKGSDSCYIFIFSVRICPLEQ